MSFTHNFLFVGDIVLESQPTLSAEVAELFSNKVIKSCNVEAPLRGFGKAIQKTGPLVDQHPDAGTWIREMGFDLFSLANNHIYDYGDEGLLQIKNSFPPGSVLGVGSEEEAYSLHIRSVDGVQYGFVSYGENGYGALNGSQHNGYAWINSSRVDQDIRTYKEQVDFLIVQVHAGVEMLDVPIPEWRKRYMELIQSGADVIIGHHPHVLQGVEEYQGKLICYSLGNFAFDTNSNHPQWNTGGILELTFQKEQKITYQLHVTQKEGQHISLWDEKPAQNHIRELNSKLSDPGYENYVDRQAAELWEKHHKKYYAKPVNGFVDYSIVGFLKFFKRLLFHNKTDYSMLWHNLFIESNIWLVKRVVNNRKEHKIDP